MNQQTSMTGNDWLSDRDRKSQARAEAARKKAALACAKKLEAAAEALSDLMRACRDCADASVVRGADDGRMILQRNILEYAVYLNERFDR